jgi:ATP-dependent Lon protease
MSEAMEKVRGVRELPIFPLPVVLFPGMPMPLHIFEERYRTMLSDIRAGDNLFGLSYFDPSASDKDMPPAGHIGCVAEVTETQALPDGRSNILAVGVVMQSIRISIGAIHIWWYALISLRMKRKIVPCWARSRVMWPTCSCAWRTQFAR